MDVNKIAFTGSTVVGRKIQEASAKSNLKRVSLELGGKSPFIIFDVDDEALQRAADDTAVSIFGNQGSRFLEILGFVEKNFKYFFYLGQSCCASSRVFVHESVHDKFVGYLKEIADSKVVGDPFQEETTNGAIISDLQFKKVLDYIKSGREQGAKVVSGGDRVGNKGYFVRPTIFTDVKDDMKIAKEEVNFA
jgi:aldehyde dehydrogenase (NAD+)